MVVESSLWWKLLKIFTLFNSANSWSFAASMMAILFSVDGNICGWLSTEHVDVGQALSFCRKSESAWNDWRFQISENISLNNSLISGSSTFSWCDDGCCWTAVSWSAAWFGRWWGVLMLDCPESFSKKFRCCWVYCSSSNCDMHCEMDKLGSTSLTNFWFSDCRSTCLLKSCLHWRMEFLNFFFVIIFRNFFSLPTYLEHKMFAIL